MSISTNSRIKVLVADDHELVRRGLSSVLELEDDLEIVGEASTGAEAVDRCQELTPDVVLLDLRMPEVNGIEACQRMKAAGCAAAVLILTTFDDEREIVEAIRAGASGYILKDVASDDLAKAIRAVAQGQSYLDPLVARKLMDGMQAEAQQTHHSHNLTSREIEILNMLGQGMSNKAIAEKLWLSERTVKSHVSNILKKLRTNTRAQAVLHAARHGIIELPDDTE
ncbi:MAG: DNA-binding response regulator [Actinobacteria bacterium]|nr:MAG: DNA-binding response regulator [Actinomycetota bacterium]